MHKTLTTFTFCLLSTILFAQDTLTFYFDENWKEVKHKEAASYYRNAFMGENKTWHVRDYFMNHKLQMTGTFKNGKLKSRVGHFVHYHENGEKLSEGNYREDKRFGKWMFWNNQGQKESEGEFVNDMKIGYWTYWHETGEKRSEGNYENNHKTGKWRFYYPEGMLEAEEDFTKYPNGIAVGYYKNGTMSYKGTIVFGVKHGEWSTWNCDGFLTLKGMYDRGKKQGEWIRAFREGEMKINFVAGESTGRKFGGIARKK